MEYTINSLAEYYGDTSENFKKKLRAQFYLVALGKDLGTYGLYQMGINGSIGALTNNALTQTVGTTDLDEAIPLLKDLLAPVMEARHIEWNNIVSSSGSKLKTEEYPLNKYPLEDPKYIVLFDKSRGFLHTGHHWDIDPIFAGRLANLGYKYQIPVFVLQGLRTYEEQVDLYVDAGGWFENGKWVGIDDGSVAVPGTSWHESGEAIDVHGPNSGLNVYATIFIKETLYNANTAIANQTDLINIGLCKPNNSADRPGKKPEKWHIVSYEARTVSGLARREWYLAYKGLTQ